MSQTVFKQRNGVDAPPGRSAGVLSDIANFLLHRPRVPTLVEVTDPASRKFYGMRIHRHIGVRVDHYAVLNIHRIGIRAPVSHVFERLRTRDAVAACWPNRLARVERRSDPLEHTRIFLLGLKRFPLFDMTPIEVEPAPAGSRCLLFECSGGYPIGIFTMYVRPAIPELGETGEAQLFSLVGFNWYGKEHWTDRHLLHRIWERIHNRATGNILNRFRQLCEWDTRSLRDAQAPAAPEARPSESVRSLCKTPT